MRLVFEAPFESLIEGRFPLGPVRIRVFESRMKSIGSGEDWAYHGSRHFQIISGRFWCWVWRDEAFWGFHQRIL